LKAARVAARRRYFDQHPDEVLRGTSIRSSRLTENDVRGIRRDVAAGASRRSIARRLGVSPATVDDVVAGRTWRHVDNSAETPS
jgi:DNA-binding NarL/FixJ family response regulator